MFPRETAPLISLLVDTTCFANRSQDMMETRQIAAYLKSQGVQLEFLVDEGTVIVKDAIPGMKMPFAL